MKRNFSYIALFFFLLLDLSSCNDERLLEDHSSPMLMEGNVPVEFLIFEPESSTRASETQKVKFQEGDVIHISASFTNNKRQLGKSYGAMKLVNGKWKQVDGSNLIWPFVATHGVFQAFYMPQSDGVLQPGTQTDAVLMAELDASFNKNGDWDLDPLEATSEKQKYGHAVELHFTHTLTHLTFINLDPGISDYFWLEKKRTPTLNNAFRLSLNENNELSLIFECNPKGLYSDDTSYIQAKAASYIPENETSIQRVKASFFLEPGDYSDIELRTNNNTPFLSLKSNETSDLKPHFPYIIDVLKSSGVTFVIKDDEPWDEDEGEYEVVVKDFVEAIVNGNEYTVNDSEGNEIGIIEPINNGARLLKNVKFPDDQKDYDRIWTSNSRFTPNIPSGRVFEGDHHYISNIKQPLFQYNSGTIQNLGLKSMTCEVTSKYVGTDNDYRADRSRRGGLCQWNRAGGLIYNIRVEDLTLVVNVEGESINQTHSAGAICGVNIGTLRDIYLSGDVKIITQNAPKFGNVSSKINLGGIVGQNTGTISRVMPLEGKDLHIEVQNNCKGDAGVFSVGGAIGFNGAIIEYISLPSVSVDCSQSDGYQGYTGGLVGRLRGSGSTNLVQGCVVGGSLESGEMSDFGDMTDSYLYTGGLAASCANFTVRDCSTTLSVNSSVKEVNENSRYATGGIFGAILAIDGYDTNKISNLTGWNTSLAGEHDENTAFMGNFAGIVPEGKDWENYSNAGVRVKSFSGINNIGTSMNINAGEESSDE